jgi:hypothetical protein
VEGYDLTPSRHRGVESGDVGVSDDWLWPTAQRRVVDLIENAHRAIAAARAPNGIDRVVRQRGVEIRETISVGASEIAIARESVRSDDRHPPERAHILLRACEILVATQRTRGCDERDTRAAAKCRPTHQSRPARRNVGAIDLNGRARVTRRNVGRVDSMVNSW